MERSVSIFMFDQFTDPRPALEIEEWRAETSDDNVTRAQLFEAVVMELAYDLQSTASPQYRDRVLGGLIFGDSDFTVNLGLGATTRVATIDNQEATSFAVITKRMAS